MQLTQTHIGVLAPTDLLTHSLTINTRGGLVGWLVGWLVGGSYGAFRLFVIYSHVSSQTASNLTTITTTKTAAAKQRTPIKTNKQESNNRQINWEEDKGGQHNIMINNNDSINEGGQRQV